MKAFKTMDASQNKIVAEHSGVSSTYWLQSMAQLQHITDVMQIRTFCLEYYIRTLTILSFLIPRLNWLNWSFHCIFIATIRIAIAPR